MASDMTAELRRPQESLRDKLRLVLPKDLVEVVMGYIEHPIQRMDWGAFEDSKYIRYRIDAMFGPTTTRVELEVAWNSWLARNGRPEHEVNTELKSWAKVMIHRIRVRQELLDERPIWESPEEIERTANNYRIYRLSPRP